MKLTRCKADDITIRTVDGFGRRFGFGAIADLDEVIGERPATKTEPARAITLSDALGDYVSLFEAIPPAVEARPLPTDRRGRIVDVVND